MNNAGQDRVVVIGAGTMGAGIAQNLLAVGAEVILADRQPTVLDAAIERIRAGLARGWRDRHDADSAVVDALARLTVTDTALDHHDVALVIEAVPEHLELKRSVITELSACYSGDEVIATNTSSLSIDALAGAFADPARFVGVHFFNPVPVSKLVEIVIGAQTSQDTLAVARAWVERLGKTAIEVRDSPGFATSRLGVAIGLEAIRMVEEGVASVDDIDTGMVLGYRHPMGPLRLTDLVGLDVRLGIAEHLASVFGSRFEPPALLRQMVAEGRLGQKTGKGFYTWD